MDMTAVKTLLEASKYDENVLKTIISLLGPVKINEPYPNDNNRTLLIWAASRHYEKIVAMLIAANCDLNKQDSDGNTALIMANSNEKIVAMLIAANCDLNKQTRGGKNTALIYAVYHKYEKIVPMLIDACCDLNIKDDAGQTALDYIKQKWTGEKRNAMIKLIEEKNKPVVVPTLVPTMLPMVVQYTTMNVTQTPQPNKILIQFLVDNHINFAVVNDRVELKY